jgi:hypothetical protein
MTGPWAGENALSKTTINGRPAVKVRYSAVSWDNEPGTRSVGRPKERRKCPRASLGSTHGPGVVPT